MPNCTQPSIEGRDLNRQIIAFLDRIHLPEKVGAWISRYIESAQSDMAAEQRKAADKLKQQTESLKLQITNLTDLRVRELVDDDEFLSKRETLQRTLAKTEEQVSRKSNEQNMFEPLLILNILCSRAKFWFATADDYTKRSLLKILCSNPTIKDKKAFLEAKKPFVELSRLAKFSCLCGDMKDVRTGFDDIDNAFGTIASNEELTTLTKNTRDLINRIDPTALNDFAVHHSSGQHNR